MSADNNRPTFGASPVTVTSRWKKPAGSGHTRDADTMVNTGAPTARALGVTPTNAEPTNKMAPTPTADRLTQMNEPRQHSPPRSTRPDPKVAAADRSRSNPNVAGAEPCASTFSGIHGICGGPLKVHRVRQVVSA